MRAGLRLALAIAAATLALRGEASAQSSPPVLAQWRALSQTEVNCVDQALRAQRLTLDGMIQRGVSPTNPFVAKIREGCSRGGRIAGGGPGTQPAAENRGEAATRKAAGQKAAAEKFATEWAAAEKAYAEKVAAAKASEKAAAEKPVAEKPAAEKAEADRASTEAAPAEKTEAETAAAEKAAEKTAAEKTATEKAASEKVAADRAAAQKVAAEKAAAEKAAAERLAAEKAKTEKAAAEKAAAEKIRAEKIAAEKLAAEKLAAEKLAAEKLAAEKAAAEKAAAEKAAARKAAPELAAVEKALAAEAAMDTVHTEPERVAADPAKHSDADRHEPAFRLAAEAAFAYAAAESRMGFVYGLISGPIVFCFGGLVFMLLTRNRHGQAALQPEPVAVATPAVTSDADFDRLVKAVIIEQRRRERAARPPRGSDPSPE